MDFGGGLSPAAYRAHIVGDGFLSRGRRNASLHIIKGAAHVFGQLLY